MATNHLIILIDPDAQAKLEAEVENLGLGGDIVGGLLFGHPLDERRRLVVSSVRLRADVGFGRENFALDQTRTSRQLDHACSLDPEADYCGVWYIHRVPSPDLTMEELDQAEDVLEDPDFSFDDLVCLVLCFYSGELSFHAFSLDSQHVARGLPPVPATLRTATDVSQAQSRPSAPPPSTNWYKRPRIAKRLILDHKRLALEYDVETEPTSTGEVIFRLRPREEPLSHHLVFYLACGPGFPDEEPHVFLLAGEERYPLLCPTLDDWSRETTLVEVADDAIAWLPRFLDEHMTAAEEALNRGDCQEAADLLTVVLAINPRMPGAARLLARAQAPLRR